MRPLTAGPVIAVTRTRCTQPRWSAAASTLTGRACARFAARRGTRCRGAPGAAAAAGALVLPRAAFLERFNHERPHQALGMRVPLDLYAPSTRPYRGLTDLTYPFHDWTAFIPHSGRLCFDRRKVNVSQSRPGSR